MKKVKPRGEVRTGGVPHYSSEPAQAEIAHLVSLFNQRHFAEAEAFARNLTGRFPRFGFGWKVLGAVLKTVGCAEDSVEPMQKAAELLQNDPQAQTNLGVTLKELGRLKEAELCYLRAIRIKPDYAEAHNSLGNICKELGRFIEAVASYRLALKVNPDYPEALASLGALLNDIGRFKEAESCYMRLLEIFPDSSVAHFHLGNILKRLVRLKDAEECFCRAIELKPDFAAAHNNLGNVYEELDRLEDAVLCYRRALEIEPDMALAQSNVIFCLNYMSVHTPLFLLTEAKNFGQLVSRNAQKRFTTWQCSPRPERLRVGLVSADLRNHPVGFFLEGVLARLASSNIEFIAYSNATNDDELTARLKQLFSEWKSLVGVSDETAADIIHKDGINILMDISGHSENNRLPIFAWKPAPVQVSWLGYPATTGVLEIDYLLADRALVPKGGEMHFTEKLWYLPDIRICLSPPFPCPDVSELPALKAGYVTFGCFQNLSKIGDNVLELWSTVLAALPGSRVRFQSRQLDNKETAEQFLRRLQSCGIDPARVSLFGASSREEYLAAHAEVDIIFDTFPYTGCTTTAESLWMGVPSLSLAGNSMISRQGVSLLGAVGLSDWVAADEADYFTKAVAFAADLPGLAALRKGLRQQAMASPLFDAARFARNFEDALWGMWEKRGVNCDNGVIS